MKTKLKNNKGITLIALVITIIVLLILAAVSIAMLTGQNGILTQAQRASEQTDIGKEKEDIALDYNGAVLKKAEEGGGDVTAQDLKDQFDLNGVKNAEATGSNPITVTFDSGRAYTIDANGNITGPTESNIVASMRIEGTKVETPPIPTGFSYVDGTVNNGYIIQDASGNQFVWVPVDKDQKLKINVTSKEDITSITLQDPYGDTILTESNVGTSYSKEQTPTINGPYILKVSTASEEKTTMLGVHSLYAIDPESDWLFTEEVALARGSSSLEEFLMGYTIEEAYAVNGSDYKNYSEPGEDYSDSVNNNGGFYIGRYEASYEDGKPASKKSTVANESSTLQNGKLWNNINQTDALSYSKAMYEGEGFTSSLLTGAVGDSKDWGNYSDDEFSNTTGLANTGSFTETEKNHIFDLAGNLEEWTTEADSTSHRVYRGR